MNSLPALQPILEQVRRALPESEIYLVGGAVRDLLLGRATHDLDFALPQHAIAAARKVADALEGAFYPLDSKRDTGRVLLQRSNGPLVLDFAALRGPDLESDLRDRDFTINAIALDLRQMEKLIDPLEGTRDLRLKTLRACAPTSFEADPVRILRAVRIAAGFELRIAPDTLQLLRVAIPQLSRISPERMRDEIFKILEGPAATGLRTLDMLGVLAVLFPELAPASDHLRAAHVFSVNNQALERVHRMEMLLDTLQLEHNPGKAANWTIGLVSLRLGRYRQPLAEHLSTALNPNRSLRSLWLFTALYFSAGADTEGPARARGEDLRLSNPEIDRLGIILRHARRPMELAKQGRLPTPREVYRFFRDTGAAGVDICLLSLADALAVYGPELPQAVWVQHIDVVRALLEAWWEAHEARVSPPPLVNGHDVQQEFDLRPGPQIGQALEAVREAQAAGEVTTREDALALIREWLENSK